MPARHCNMAPRLYFFMLNSAELIILNDPYKISRIYQISLDSYLFAQNTLL